MVLAFETQSLRAAISVTSGGAYSHSCITREEDQVWKDFPRLPQHQTGRKSHWRGTTGCMWDSGIRRLEIIPPLYCKPSPTRMKYIRQAGRTPCLEAYRPEALPGGDLRTRGGAWRAYRTAFI